METINTTDLKKQWEQLLEEKPKTRIRNAADELGVTEAQLLATKCGDTVTRLTNDFKAILKDIETLGKVTAISRNNDVVHERKGVYSNMSTHGPVMGLFVNEDIDLRIFFSAWGTAYAVSETMRGMERKSIQFFAKDGEAIHKIYLNKDSHVDAFEKLVDTYKNEDQSTTQDVSDKTPEKPEKPDSEIDVKGFQEDWRQLKDTHDFYGLVNKYGLSRTQALRLAPEGYAIKVSNETSRKMLNLAAEKNVPIMVFVGNQGIIQIHTGEVNKLMDYEEWFNVMDPDFNLHLKENAIVNSWIVKKPTEDGTVHSIETFDDKGNMIVQFFGKRKPGIPELESWIDIINTLEKENKL